MQVSTRRLLSRSRSKQATDGGRLAYELLLDADTASGDEAARLLTKCCEECERLVTGNPRHAFALHVWGAALMKQAVRAATDEADRLYERAEEKFALALEIDPDDAKLRTDRNMALLQRAGLRPGMKGARDLERLCQNCARQSDEKPQDAHVFSVWGCALCGKAARTSDSEAEQLYAEAEAKFALALEIAPHDGNVTTALGLTLVRRARPHKGETGDRLLARATELFGAAIRRRPSNLGAVSGRAFALFARARRDPGDETNRQVSQALRQLNEIAPTFPDSHVLLQTRGVLLWAKAGLAGGEESVRLLRQAQQAFADAESRMRRSCAYNLGCVHALLGEPEECRRWLEVSGEPGLLVSQEQMDTEPDLQSVRGFEWFPALLTKHDPQPGVEA